MRIQRALEIRTATAGRIADLHSISRIAGMTSNAINHAMRDIWASLPPRTPLWVKSFCEGYAAALNAETYRDWLCYGGFIGDTFYSVESGRPDYYGKHGIDSADWLKLSVNRGHYWKEAVQYRGGIFRRNSVMPYFLG